jgi:hypothetical protein
MLDNTSGPELQASIADTHGEWRAAAPTDDRFTITGFDDQAAAHKCEARISLDELARLITAPIKAEKSELPWLVFGRFGDQRSDKGCLRRKGNLLAITGIECDYDGKMDGGSTSFEQAVEQLRHAGIEAVAYTSPSHTAEAPRWRVLCPFWQEYPSEQRDRFLDRLNGVLGGVLEPESWTLSRAYYFGNIEGKPPVGVEVIIGTRLDLRDDLDAAAVGKGGGSHTARTEKRTAPAGLIECDNDPRLIEEAKKRIAIAAINSDGASDTGQRTFSLAAWLLDMRTRDGLILSELAIGQLLMEHWPAACDPEMIGQTIANAITHRSNERGCEEVLSAEETFTGFGLDWDKRVTSKFRSLTDMTIYTKLNATEGEYGDLARSLIRQLRGRGYTPNEVCNTLQRYSTLPVMTHYGRSEEEQRTGLRTDVARVFTEPVRAEVTLHVPDGLFAEIIERAFGSLS